jgi:cysteinyl-tRNA synthetase
MAIRFHNTFTRRVEEFVPQQPGEVRMYNCGPTVYSSPHIGNFRSFLLADLLRRFLEWRGYRVRQVMNITDVGHLLEDAEEGEDKLEAAARKAKLTAWQLAERYIAEFFAALDHLNFRG